MILAIKNFRLSRAVTAAPLLDEICLDATELALKARKLKFWLPKSFMST
jgi:hypothetical protein